MNPARAQAIGTRLGLDWRCVIARVGAWRWLPPRGAFPASRISPWGWPSSAALGLLLFTAILVQGCGSLEPAPVDSRDLGSAVPPGYHRVRAGETLYAIAWGQGLDYHRVADWNGVSPPYTIYPAQLIRVIPPDTAEAPPRAPAKGGQAGKVASRSDAKPATPTKSSARSGADPPVPSGKLRWQWPVVGKVVQTYRNGDRTRQGIRIAGSPGEKVMGAEAGSVVYSGSGLIGYGNLIILKHNKDYLSAYGFNRKLLVKEGDTVARGAQIAELGQGPGGEYLLHFEIRRAGSAVDPLPLLPAK